MEQQPLKTKIAIADDHNLFRKGLIKLLDQDRYELLFDVNNGKMLVDRMQEMDPVLPDIVIMDIEMPGMNGYETVAWLRIAVCCVLYAQLRRNRWNGLRRIDYRNINLFRTAYNTNPTLFLTPKRSKTMSL